MKNITIKTGDLLLSDCDILINTVNCAGVMGAGIAKQFKERYPNMFKPYKMAIGIHGRIFLFDDGSFGQTASWSIVVEEPYDKFCKPPVRLGQTLKSTNGSIEGIVSLIRCTDNGYIVLVGNMEFTNRQLCDMFGISKKIRPCEIECVELP